VSQRTNSPLRQICNDRFYPLMAAANLEPARGSASGPKQNFLSCYIIVMTGPSNRCILCQIIDGSARSSQIYRDEYCVAFLDLNPINPGHTLVCPIRHVSSFTELAPNEAMAIIATAQRLARTQKSKLPGCRGVNLLLSDGEVAGQEIPHAHFHVVPRAENDKFGWRRFGSAQTREELDSLAATLREQ